MLSIDRDTFLLITAIQFVRIFALMWELLAGSNYTVERCLGSFYIMHSCDKENRTFALSDLGVMSSCFTNSSVSFVSEDMSRTFG